MPLFHLLTQDRGYQQVAPLSYLDLDPFDGYVVSQAFERPAPRLDVCRIGVNEGAVDVEDHPVQGHGSKLCGRREGGKGGWE
jgi:hypothetical protein